MKTKIACGRWAFLGFVLAVLLPSTLPAPAYMKLGDIKGESTDAGHVDEIEILSWSWGMTQSEAASGGVGKVSMQDITCTKVIDKSSPKLMESCANGTTLPRAVFVVRKPGGRDVDSDYLTYELENVLVTSFSHGGATGDDRIPEKITLNFTAIKVTYIPLSAAGAGEPVVFQFSLGDPTVP